MKQDLVSLIQRARSQLGASTYLWATIIVIVAGMVVSFLSAATQNQRYRDESDDFLNRQSMRIEDAILQRMQGYEQLLDSSVALFNINGEVSRNQWREFVEEVAVNQRFPGTLATGYGDSVTASQRTEHIERVRAEGFDDYTITPSGQRDLYVPVTYIEPVNAQNQLAFGYDMYSEAKRRAALEYARDTGQPSVSAAVRLVQEGDRREVQPGVLIFKPVYDFGSKPTNTAERRTQLKGYSYAALRMGDLYGSLLGNFTDDERIAIGVSDLSDDTDTVLFQSDNFERVARHTEANFAVSRFVPVMNKTWRLDVKLDNAVFRGDSLTPTAIFVLGSVISVFIGAFIFVLMLNRLGRIAIHHEVELQQAKDELLALASHQLRTPASGVKQYVGMVLQGYSGRISREQRQMLERAFESNERQLEIINQLLYVAKADAGQLRLEKERHNFTAVVNGVVEEFANLANEHKVSIKPVRLKSVELKADKRYVRMIVENLLSNAIKYSFEGGRVYLKIETSGRQLKFSIKDEGVGIDEADLPKLFQKFTRLENTLSSRAGGSGIGLYLTQQLAQAHRGTVKVKTNAPRKGATFILTMPGVVYRRKRKQRSVKSK